MVAGEEEERVDWNFQRHNSRPADDRASFYSADSRTASGSFANNLGMLSRNDFTRHYSAGKTVLLAEMSYPI